jgi:hypothetical protein
MSDDMLGRVVKKLVEVPERLLGIILDLLVKLVSDAGFERALKGFLRSSPAERAAEGGTDTDGDCLTEYLTSAMIPALPGLTEEESNEFGKLVGADFQALTDFPTLPVKVSVRRLVSSQYRSSLIAVAGGYRAVLSANQIAWLMTKQSGGELGPLTVRDGGNIFVAVGRRGLVVLSCYRVNEKWVLKVRDYDSFDYYFEVTEAYEVVVVA